MDELEISGKRYVSAKRIAKENKYHPDYVGQLIRAGRVIGTKVGRAWYVDQDSFVEYLGKERGAFTPLTQKPAPLQHEEIRNFVESMSHQSAPAEPEKVFVHPEPQPVRKFFVEEPQVVPEKKPIANPTLTYISDNSPLFPAIPKRASTEAIKKPIEIQNVTIKKEEYRIAETLPAQQFTAKKRSAWKTGFAFLSLVVIAGAFFTFTFFGSVGINSTIIVEQGKPASVAFSQEKTLCFIFNDCQNAQN